MVSFEKDLVSLSIRTWFLLAMDLRFLWDVLDSLTILRYGMRWTDVILSGWVYISLQGNYIPLDKLIQRENIIKIQNCFVTNLTLMW